MPAEIHSSDEYYGAVERILKPSPNPTVWIGRKDGMPYNVPNPANMTPAQRAETLEKIRERMDLGPED